MKKFGFRDKSDILGFFGSAQTYPIFNEPSGHIYSLGFIVNTCPVRDLLKYEKDQFASPEGIAQQVEEFVLDEATDLTVGYTILGIFLLGFAVCGCYFLLKNRGTLCKGNQADGQGEHAQVANDSIQLDSSKTEPNTRVDSVSVVHEDNVHQMAMAEAGIADMRQI